MALTDPAAGHTININRTILPVAPTAPARGCAMKAEHRKELETNALAQGASSLVDRVKTGRVGNYWVIAVVAAIIVVLGVWWYAAREGRKADAITWTGYVGLMRGPTNSEVDDFVKNHEKTTAAQLARLELARLRMGPDGIALLRSDESSQRAKGVENLEKARADLLKLADEFSTDPTLRASVLSSAAEAELALVGVPKDGSGTEKRGAVKVAAELYREAAKAIGANTPAGEGLTKRADDLEKNAIEIAILVKIEENPSSPFSGIAAPVRRFLLMAFLARS